MKRRVLLGMGGMILSCLLISSALAQGQSVPDDPEVGALREFRTQHAQALFYYTGSRITRVYGTTFGNGSSPAQTFGQFVTDYAPMFGVSAQNLQPISPLQDQPHTLKLMYDAQTDSYKFTLVYYSQFQNGLPVFRADIRGLVRNDGNNSLVLVSSGLRELADFTVSDEVLNDIQEPEFIQQQRALGIAAAQAISPTLINFSDAEVVVWAGVDDMVIDEPVVALVFTGDNFAPNAPSDEKWLFVADLTNGNILYQESRLLDIDVNGNVSGMASQGPAADICADEVLVPMPHARANIQGQPYVYTNADGDFVIPNGGTSPVTVESRIWGQWFQVFNWAGSDALLTEVVDPPGPVDFVHNAANTDPLRRAEANCYVAANYEREIVLSHNPSYPTLMNESFPVYANRTDGFCPGNAWYDPALVSINFCQAGGGSPNTAWTSVIYHEYGHHLVAAGGSGQGQYGEGTGDVMSVILLDDPRIGIGFFGSCNTWLRDAENTLQYPCSGEIHECGQLIAGCVWDAREELILSEPEDYLSIVQSLAINSIPVHTGSLITPQITIDWLTLDDDDGDIGNGNPHRAEICAAFAQHNMDCPELDAINFEYPAGQPDFVTPEQTSEVQVNVVGVADAPVPGTGTVSYRVGSGGLFITMAMSEGNPNEYTATLPAADCGQTIEYYFSADSASLGTFTDPPDAPNSVFSTISAGGLGTALFADNFESDLGWTVTNGGGLTDGAWNRGVPVGGGDRGDPPTDGDASGQCYLTDNVDGNSDVDDGSTTLTSPIMDASGVTAAIITYDRWFSNDFGDGPYSDTFDVQISDDNGATWRSLEIVGPNPPEVSGGWFQKQFNLANIPGFALTNQFRIRFTAQDVDPQSVVEAAVDGVELIPLLCDASCPQDLDGSGAVGVEDLLQLLADWGECPGCPSDIDGDGSVSVEDLLNLLAAWGPC